MKPAVKWTLIGGIICLLAPFAGFVFTIIGMVGAFHALGDSGISDPKILSAHIGTSLISTMAGLVVGIIGLVLVVVTAILHFATRESTAARRAAAITPNP